MIINHSHPLFNMAIYAVSLVLIKGMSLIMLPLIAQFLTPSQIGEIELLSVTTVFLSLFVGLAMHENLYRFVGIQRDEKAKHQQASELYSCCFVISFFIASAITSATLLVPALQFSFSSTQWCLIGAILFIESGLAISTAWLRMQDKAMVFFKVSLSIALLQVVCVLAVLTTNPDVTAIFAVGVVCSITQLVSLHIINRFTLSFPSLELMVKYLRYSLPLMLSALVAFGLSGAERWVLASTTDVATVGLYAIAAKFSFAMCILVQPFGMWWMPKRFNLLESNSDGESQVSRITQWGLIYILLLAVSVAIGARVFIQTWLPVSFIGASDLVVGAMVVVVFKEWSELVNIGILSKEKTNQILAINIVSTALGLALCWLCYQLGVWGIIFALIIAQATKTLMIAIASQKQTPLNYQVTPLLVLLALTLSSLWIALSLHFVVQLVALWILSIGAIILTAALTGIVPVRVLYGRFADRKIVAKG